MNLIIKAVVVGLVGVATANAAQRITVDAEFRNKPTRELEQAASRYKVASLAPLGNAYAHTNDLISVYKGSLTLDDYVDNARARVKNALQVWIERDLLAGNAAFIHPNVANTANVAGVGVVGGRAAVLAGTAIPMANAARHDASAWAPNAVPADLTRDAFRAALFAHVDSVTTAQLTAADGRVARPANGHIASLQGLDAGTKAGFEFEIADWIDNLLPVNQQFVDNAVANQGTLGHGVANNIGGTSVHTNAPGGNFRDDFVGQLGHILASANL